MSDLFNGFFFPHDKKEDHFKALDGLRGIAVLFVLLSHSSNLGMYFHEFINFSKIGKVGVYLFFVLSAYLLDRQIALALLDKKASKYYWGNYLVRRFLRIYPLFVLALLMHLAISKLLFTTVITDIGGVLMHIFLLEGESIFWSIPVEFKYYFISPVLMLIINRFLKWNLKNISIWIISISIISAILVKVIDLDNNSTFRFLPIFLVGTLLSVGELIIDRTKENKMIFKKSFFELSGWIAVFLILISIPYYFKTVFGFSFNTNDSIFYIPYSICWGLVLLGVKHGNWKLKSLLELKMFRFVGTISFSVYLFHLPILEFVHQSDSIPDGYKIYLFLFVTMVFSSVTYLLIERPLSKIRLSMFLNEKTLQRLKN